MAMGIARRNAAQVRREQFRGVTFIYFITNGDVSKIGIGGITRLDTWLNRGWTEVLVLEAADRSFAIAAEQQLLNVIRGWGYPPVMPPGFDGHSETFDSSINPWVYREMEALVAPPPSVPRTAESTEALQQRSFMDWVKRRPGQAVMAACAALLFGVVTVATGMSQSGVPAPASGPVQPTYVPAPAERPLTVKQEWAAFDTGMRRAICHWHRKKPSVLYEANGDPVQFENASGWSRRQIENFLNRHC